MPKSSDSEGVEVGLLSAAQAKRDTGLAVGFTSAVPLAIFLNKVPSFVSVYAM